MSSASCALTDHLRDHRPRGSTTLFVASDIASGEVRAKHDSRARRVAFLDFMNRVVAAPL